MTVATLCEPQHSQAERQQTALRVFFRIAKAWKLTAAQGQKLLDCSRTSYFRWQQVPGSARLTTDQVYRLSYIFGIYKDLQMLIPNARLADTWATKPNDAPLFGGRAPIERMCNGDLTQLALVRRYLDAECG